jgi:hypothetical protein
MLTSSSLSEAAGSSARVLSRASKLAAPYGNAKHAIRHDQFPNRCFLVIECNGQGFITPLMFEDSTFCEEICELLQHQCGHTIEEIGDLDLIRALDR